MKHVAHTKSSNKAITSFLLCARKTEQQVEGTALRGDLKWVLTRLLHVVQTTCSLSGTSKTQSTACRWVRSVVILVFIWIAIALSFHVWIEVCVEIVRLWGAFSHHGG